MTYSEAIKKLRNKLILQPQRVVEIKANCQLMTWYLEQEQV